MADLGQLALDVKGLTTGYRTRPIIHGVDLQVAAGEVVALIGHNGAGKTTLLKAVFHLLPTWSGTVTFPWAVGMLKPRSLLRLGVGYLPQGSQVFTDLSVIDNIRLSSSILPNAAARAEGVARALQFLPLLVGRQKERAGNLSGGERQMLAFACAMSLEPRLLLLDEPSLGLGPALARRALDLISDICKSRGVGALIVEQKVQDVLRVADRAYVLRRGKVTYDGRAAALLDEATLRDVFL